MRPAAIIAGALAFAPLPLQAKEANSPAANRSVEAEIGKNQASLSALYKDLHAHPEIAFQEARSAKLLAAEMRKLGFEVTEGVGKTGVVAIYRNGDGPTVMVRTDMDALPMQEKTGLPYASSEKQMSGDSESPVMHACGHDMHMTWWVGTARTLTTLKDTWRGTLVFIAQPAEETLHGAQAMIDDGLFTRFPKPDYAFAAHVGNAPAGAVVLKDGAAASASDAYEIIFHGRGGHGSMPSATIDPIVIGSHFVSDIQSVVSREKPESEFGVISVGSFQSGTVANIIPDQATLRLTARSFSPKVRELLRSGIDRTAKASAAMAGAPDPQITHINGAKVLMNDSALVAKTNAFLAPVLGEKLTLIPAYMPGSPPSEDFAEYLGQGIPGVFFAIGGYNPRVIADYAAKNEALPANHSPFFAPDPDLAIAPGVQTLSLAVISVAGHK